MVEVNEARRGDSARGDLAWKLSSLISRVEKATGPNYALEVDIFKFFNPDYRDYVEGRGGLVHKNDGEDQRVLSNVRPPNVTASIDAAVALAERVLPGWRHAYEKRTNGACLAWVDEADDEPAIPSFGPTISLALVLATLRALQSKTGDA